MSTQIEQLEAERGKLLEIVESSGRKGKFVAYLAVPIIFAVVTLLASAVFEAQLSLQGLGLAAFFSWLVWFILSRQIRSGSRVALVADIVFGIPATVDMTQLQTQIAEYDKRIASLKAGRQTSRDVSAG
jgi:positive regulator of sigma E activity